MNLKRSIVWLALLAALVLVAALGWRVVAQRQARQKAQAQAVQARASAPLQLQADEVLSLRRQSLELTVPVSGALRAVDSAMVKARVAGELQGLVLREGDSVRAGQEVARIDATEAQARLRQAQQQAQAAKFQVEINQRQYDNNRALVAQGFISATALVTSQANLEAAQASHQAAEAAADLARKALADTVLRSPISGLVAQRLAQPGERVGVESRIIEVLDLSQLELEAQLPPADAAAVRLGQKAQLAMEGTPLAASATVVRINPSAQPGSRSVPVYLRVAQPKANGAAPLLRQGLFVQGLLATGQADALAVPLDAVRTDKPVPYLQTVRAGKVLHLPVATGARVQIDGQTVVAVAGAGDRAGAALTEGIAVLVGRIGTLPEGTAVSMPAATAVAAADAPAAVAAPAAHAHAPPAPARSAAAAAPARSAPAPAATANAAL